jgi:hypothetical protein
MRSVCRAFRRRPPFVVLLVATTIAIVAPSSRAQVASPPPAGSLAAPTKLWAVQIEPTTLTLQWTGAPGATSYRLYHANGAGSPQVIGNTGGRVTQWIVAIRPGMTGAAQQFFIESRAEPNLSSPRAAFPPITPVAGARGVLPNATNVVATETSPGVITLTWTPVAGATAYAIGRAVFPGGFARFCPLCESSGRFIDSTAVAGKKHTYSVIAMGPTGRSGAAQSNTLTPGSTGTVASSDGSGGTPTSGSGTPIVNPQIPSTVTATSDTTPPAIVAPPSGSGALAMPPADTGSCVTAGTTTAATTADSVERISVIGARVGMKTAQDPTSIPTPTPIVRTTSNLGGADYQRGKCLNPGAMGYPALWDSVASASGMTSAQRVAAWKEIGVVALEYRHILNRLPTSAETQRDVAALEAGTTWKQLWRTLAHSAERDQRFGYWAPAPIPDSIQAGRDFGMAVPPWTSQQCSGGLGPKCGGGIPDIVNGKVAPVWFGAFRMPDGTQLAYVEIGVAVGSILHDAACLKDKGGLNCNGLGAGDLIKTGLWPAGLEWNKASWNVIDQRTWRAKFGPYPTDPLLRDKDWYDDLRPMPARPAMMAPAISMLAWPGLTIKYTGGESRQSSVLKAPAGTSLDDTDVAYCASRAFGSTGWFVGKASWGICK